MLPLVLLTAGWFPGPMEGRQSLPPPGLPAIVSPGLPPYHTYPVLQEADEETPRDPRREGEPDLDVVEDKGAAEACPEEKKEEAAKGKENTKKGHHKKSGEMPTRVFANHWIEKKYDAYQEKKEKHDFPVTVGAWHWPHINTGGPSPTGYGIPNGLQGTYYWYVVGNPILFKACDEAFIKEVGGSFDFRARENDRFRPFFPDLWWFWEGYGYVDTPWGKFKGGQIWSRFGLDWDGTFWGNVPYFDGFKLDPELGFSWEKTWDLEERLKIDTFVQFFVVEDSVNGSINFAGPNSVPRVHERNQLFLRAVPKMEFCNGLKLETGFSALVSEIEVTNPALPIRQNNNSAWAIDVTALWKDVRVFGEILQLYGTRSPAHYVTGGPSDQTTNLLTGIHYKVGPATFRFSYSAGWYDNPGGSQHLFVPGITLALTNNIDFYAEYVRWNTYSDLTGFSEFEDGLQFVINWRL